MSASAASALASSSRSDCEAINRPLPPPPLLIRLTIVNQWAIRVPSEQSAWVLTIAGGGDGKAGDGRTERGQSEGNKGRWKEKEKEPKAVDN